MELNVLVLPQGNDRTTRFLGGMWLFWPHGSPVTVQGSWAGLCPGNTSQTKSSGKWFPGPIENWLR